jgi:Flp pilus assembly protein TadB
VEKLGPFKSLDRSASLTRGYRWKVFGIALLPALIGAIVIAVVSAALSPLIGPMAAALGSFLCEAIFNTYEAILAVVTYHDLRVAKEGVDIDRIAAVFD